MRATDLSVGERLFLIRKRGGTAMADAAAAFGVSLNRYREWERDEITPTAADGVTKSYLALDSLSKEDRYLIHRRRSGLTMQEIADELGCCQWWVRRMERGDIDDKLLADYWAAAA